jgi:hypothetical protein
MKRFKTVQEYLDHWTYPIPAGVFTLDDWEKIGEMIGKSLAQAEIDIAMRDKAALETEGRKLQ